MRPTTLWIPIGTVLLLSACGGDGSPVALSTDSMDPSAPTTSLLIEVPLPGFVPRQINLVETELFSTALPILSPNYAVAWTGSFTDGRTLAQSRSNQPITLDPCTIPFGSQTLTASAYNPLDFGLFFPLAETDVNITVYPEIDREAIGLAIEPISALGELPLSFRVVLIDSATQEPLFPPGEQPPLTILNFRAEGSWAEEPSQSFSDNFGVIALFADSTDLRFLEL